MICPELVAGDGQGDQVEQGGDPAVEGGLLVAGVQRRHPLLLTALLARLTAHKAPLLDPGSTELTLVCKLCFCYNNCCWTGYALLLDTHSSCIGMSSTRAGLRTKKATPVRPSWTRPQAETTVQSIESFGPHSGIPTQACCACHFYSERVFWSSRYTPHSLRTLRSPTLTGSHMASLCYANAEMTTNTRGPCCHILSDEITCCKSLAKWHSIAIQALKFAELLKWAMLQNAQFYCCIKAAAEVKSISRTSSVRSSLPGLTDCG